MGPCSTLCGEQHRSKVDTQWNYQANSFDRDRQDHMVTCLVEIMEKLTVKPVNSEKMKEVQQGQDKNMQSSERD